MIARLALIGALVGLGVAFAAPRLGYPEFAPAAFAVAIILALLLRWQSYRHKETDD
jgi:hypothetical protein